MRPLLNDCLRQLIGWTIRALGLVCSICQHRRIRAFKTNQRRLKRKYNLSPDTPLKSYDTEVARSIRHAASRHGPNAKFATTSGSTGAPKEILYNRRRLLVLKLIFSDMFARACYAFRITRTSLYVFSSFETDTSLTSLLLDENTWPPCVATLQAPYRVQHHPAIRSLTARYGLAAVRLWLLTISNPGVLYSTNPSTISTFLDQLARDWARSSSLIRDWFSEPGSFDPAVKKIFRRLQSRGVHRRLKRIALSAVPVPLSVCAPAVTAYICWTGGYVQPFLDRLATYLPPEDYHLIPMYSMSTETIATLPYFQKQKIAFLPLAPGIVYEFIDDAERVIDSARLEPGKLYEMVVSDAYGLRRYRTDDLFLCRQKVHNLPDLTFVRRRRLAHSFTGEKVTGEQISAVFEQMRARFSAQLADRVLTCVPAEPPHYKVLLIGDSHPDDPGLADYFEALLSQLNCEYRSKRVSGRLGAIEIENIKLEQFIAMNRTWEGQFKFLPLLLHQNDDSLMSSFHLPDS